MYICTINKLNSIFMKKFILLALLSLALSLSAQEKNYE